MNDGALVLSTLFVTERQAVADVKPQDMAQVVELRASEDGTGLVDLSGGEEKPRHGP